jgi:hypothetical protein
LAKNRGVRSKEFCESVTERMRDQWSKKNLEERQAITHEAIKANRIKSAHKRIDRLVAELNQTRTLLVELMLDNTPDPEPETEQES